jgi:hypothetical protein
LAPLQTIAKSFSLLSVQGWRPICFSAGFTKRALIASILPQSDCADKALIACHHVHGQRNWEMFPDAGVSVLDFSTSVATRHGVIHQHLLDLYFTASLAVHGEWSGLESDIIARHVPEAGVFLDIGAHQNCRLFSRTSGLNPTQPLQERGI